ncbi:apyrase-like isoform X2 [Cylas formicarius]|nr:apyrase-like isoform X2 [Cylas formicarius]
MLVQLQEMKKRNPSALFFNAGDNFQGTWYYTSGKWNITQHFMAKFPWDAITLGNHEFDDKLDGLVPFMKQLKTPFVIANLDHSDEPRFERLYSKSVVIERSGKKIGVIGALTYEMLDSPNLENLRIYPESPSINAEAERLVRDEGVFTVIVLSHAGYEVDKIIAANASEKIGLIVGSHTHSFLWTGTNYPGYEEAVGPYPTVVRSKHHKDVLIVQASAFARYVGNITVFYNSEGDILDYSGAPIYLKNSLPQEKKVDAEMLSWKSKLRSSESSVIGTILGNLDLGCYNKECTLADVIADGMAYAFADKSEPSSAKNAPIAIMNAAGMCAGMEKGEITYYDAWMSQPYNNTIEKGQIRGSHLKDLFEQGAPADNYIASYSNLNILQVSGVQIVYNLTRPRGSRVTSLKIRCQECDNDIYQDLNPDQKYDIVYQSYLKSNDKFSILGKSVDKVEIGKTDLEVFLEYMEANSPLYQRIEGRITVTT